MIQEVYFAQDLPKGSLWDGLLEGEGLNTTAWGQLEDHGKDSSRSSAWGQGRELERTEYKGGVRRRPGKTG